MTRKYRNGKASGEPKRDLKYSPEYLAYRQSRGGESVKVSQCDLDLDGTADSIVSAWRHPAVGKSEHCGDPYLFWPVTGISTLLNPHSPPTGIQTHASPQGDQAPTGIGLEIDMDEDGFYAGPNNLPPYDFDDNDDTVGTITLLNSVDQGPTGISTIAPLQNANSGPIGISTIAPLQNANSGPTGISLQIDMDEDGVYAPDDVDDNDGSVGRLLTSVNSGPTGISLQIDMDEDGVYAPDDVDDNDPSVSVDPPGAITNVTLENAYAGGYWRHRIKWSGGAGADYIMIKVHRGFSYTPTYICEGVKNVGEFAGQISGGTQVFDNAVSTGGRYQYAIYAIKMGPSGWIEGPCAYIGAYT